MPLWLVFWRTLGVLEGMAEGQNRRREAARWGLAMRPVPPEKISLEEFMRTPGVR
jgi:hypothetical protein